MLIIIGPKIQDTFASLIEWLGHAVTVESFAQSCRLRISNSQAVFENFGHLRPRLKLPDPEEILASRFEITQKYRHVVSDVTHCEAKAAEMYSPNSSRTSILEFSRV